MIIEYILSFKIFLNLMRYNWYNILNNLNIKIVSMKLIKSSQNNFMWNRWNSDLEKFQKFR